MSYLQYKPVNKRFKEFIGILATMAITGFIGGAFAMMQSGTTDVAAGSEAAKKVFIYGFIGIIVGLIVSVLVVNTSRKSGE